MDALDVLENIREKDCPVNTLLQEVKKNKCNDCGKCTFGYEGITQMDLILTDLTEKKGRSGDLPLLRELSEMMESQSLCEEGMDIARAAAFALREYAPVFESHAAKKECRAGVCKKFMTHHILPERCTGCGDCMDVCDEDAILGKKKFVHIIVMDECTQCGACVSACEEDAIILAGTKKPRIPKKPIPCKAR